MAPLKQKGDTAEMMVAADLVRRGYKIAFPFGEDWDFDLIVCRDERLERVQVKYTESNGEVIAVHCKSNSLTAGRVISVKLYTAAMIDWLAVYDKTTDCCYYVPATELADGMSIIHLRLKPARNNQQKRIRHASSYVDLRDTPPVAAVEPAGLEPAPSSVQGKRSPN
jgi:hypothetical protein